MFSVEVIATLQSWSTPELDSVFRFFTNLGNSIFMPVFVAFIYFYIDRRLGYLLLVGGVAANMLNMLLKLFFNIPRPPLELHKVTILPYAPPYDLSFPSNHAQASGTFWLIFAVWLQKPWAWLVAVFMGIMISISRVFLGVHYIGDIVAGLAIGALLAGVILGARPWIGRYLFSLSLPYQMLLSASAPLLLLLADRSTETFFFAGAVSGLGLAYVLEPRLVSSRRVKNLAAFLGGLVTLLAAMMLLTMVSGPPIWSLLQSFVMLLLAGVVGPWVGLKWQEWRA